MAHTDSHNRSSSEGVAKISGQQRRALANLSTNLAGPTRISKREDVKRRRHDPREPGQENGPAVPSSVTSSDPRVLYSDDLTVREHFESIAVGSSRLDHFDSDSNTPHSVVSQKLAEEHHHHVDAHSDDSDVHNEHKLVEENFEEADDDDDDADEEETYYERQQAPALCEPQEPRWNRHIFSELQRIMQKYSRTTLDADDEDTYDVTMVAEYAPEIFNYLHELEHKLAPDPNYMKNQSELKWEMRAVLIDWVVQVHQRFNLLPETLFLTVNYIDRFLSRRRVSLARFQLVGAVALFIAAKYEEINCPTVQEVAYMADNAYTVDDFFKAELFMIDVLEFDMGWPGPMSFLRRTSKADDYDYETRTLAKYFLEVTIMDERFVASQPSWLAAGAHYLLRKILNKGPWTELHVFYSGYTEEQLRPLAKIYLEVCLDAENHHKAIFEKYQERRYRRLSLFVQEFLTAMR
ncbi:hypothetical protein PUMCH_001730 [Australozyma saopauloensis]|uniref:Cyclin N-terminal domain-containing protein n=1 Tax=Australozyma saopauloensis TaxID=291208 RepID=A0AAX4H8B1_9ASCO|nr:hypothetical protein PUMCH_001730 [[Candida] saopauloensis]